MRTILTAVFGAILVLVGYSFRAVPVSAQTAGDWLPFTAGEVLRLEVDLPGGVGRHGGQPDKVLLANPHRV